MAFTHPDYTIIKTLGRGGSATVYLAVQLSLNRRVALKVLHGLMADPSQGERFLREGRIVAKLNHPHIVPVYDVAEHPETGQYFMTMEYLPGGSLADDSGARTVAAWLRTFQQLCAALTYAHDAGFVHRDVKPDNVLFRTPEHALLADFGIARAADSETRMTMTGAMLGTPDYMSPEQVAGTEVTARSDLYSLGVMLFEALAGYRPLQGDSAVSTGLQHVVAPPLPLPPPVAHFQPIIDRLLAKRGEDRYESAHAVALALSERFAAWQVDPETVLATLHSGEAPERKPLTSSFAPQGRKPRRWGRVAGLTAVVGSLAAGAWWFTTGATDREPGALPQVRQQTAPPPEAAPTALERALAEGQRAFSRDRWFDGADGAVARFRAALALEPGNERATAALAEIFCGDRTAGSHCCAKPGV